MGRSLFQAEDDVLEARANIFRALGDENRLRIFQHLVEAEEPLNVTALCERTGLSSNLVSHHLRCLANCTLVEASKDGRKRFYEVRLPQAVEMVRLADECIEQDIENVLECDVVSKTANEVD